jgi:hypothetical protein
MRRLKADGYPRDPLRGEVMRLRIDLDRAAQLYVESAEAQHGDVEMARWEAEDWLRIFNQVLDESAYEEKL